MYKFIKNYFIENDHYINQRYIETQVEDLVVGHIVNIEYKEFIEKSGVELYVSDYFDEIKLRADFCIHLLENYFSADESENKARFKSLHKGTPYYFIALGRLLDRDYEGFGYYMDMAVVQDNKNMNLENRPEASAAERAFLGFNEYPPQFRIDNKINEYIFGQIVNMFTVYKDSSPESLLSIIDFKNKFVISNLRNKDNPYHSIVSSFYSWIHECQYLVWLLNITPIEQNTLGSMEPYYLHLAKGALILESIGKMIIHKKSGVMCNCTLGKILNDYLNNDLFKSRQNINQFFENGKIETLDELLKYILTHESFDRVIIFKIILTIRNTASHSLNWNAAMDFEKTQKDLYHIMAHAIFAMIEIIP